MVTKGPSIALYTPAQVRGPSGHTGPVVAAIGRKGVPESSVPGEVSLSCGVPSASLVVPWHPPCVLAAPTTFTPPPRVLALVPTLHHIPQLEEGTQKPPIQSPGMTCKPGSPPHSHPSVPTST